jgi:putative acetyltransferase
VSDLRIRRSSASDVGAILDLYLAVAAIEGGLARTVDEIDRPWLDGVLDASWTRGLSMVAERDGRIVGELHAYRPAPRCFHHVLSDLTIAISPDAQGQGVGRRLFSTFLSVVEAEYPDIVRVELFARESNTRGLSLYASLGFREDGRLRGRCRGVSGALEDDIVMGWRRPA